MRSRFAAIAYHPLFNDHPSGTIIQDEEFGCFLLETLFGKAKAGGGDEGLHLAKEMADRERAYELRFREAEAASAEAEELGFRKDYAKAVRDRARRERAEQAAEDVLAKAQGFSLRYVSHKDQTSLLTQIDELRAEMETLDVESLEEKVYQLKLLMQKVDAKKKAVDVLGRAQGLLTLRRVTRDDASTLQTQIEGLKAAMETLDVEGLKEEVRRLERKMEYVENDPFFE